MVDADYHLNGNHLSNRNLDSAVELADVGKYGASGSGSSGSSSHTQEIQEPFAGAHNAKKYKVEWHEAGQGVLNDPLISDITGWLKHKKQS